MLKAWKLFLILPILGSSIYGIVIMIAYVEETTRTPGHIEISTNKKQAKIGEVIEITVSHHATAPDVSLGFALESIGVLATAPDGSGKRIGMYGVDTKFLSENTLLVYWNTTYWHYPLRTEPGVYSIGESFTQSGNSFGDRNWFTENEYVYNETHVELYE